MFCKYCGKDIVGLNKCLYCGYIIDPINALQSKAENSEIIESSVLPELTKVENEASEIKLNYYESVANVKPLDNNAKNKFAIVGFILSLIPPIFGFTSMIGLIFSIIGLIKRKEFKSGNGFAIAGIVMTLVYFIAICILTYVFVEIIIPQLAV